MAPHHGSARLDSAGLAAWARPRVVVSCQGPPRGPNGPRAAYEARGATFLRTDADGAVTVRGGPGGLVVETFRGGQRFVVRQE